VSGVGVAGSGAVPGRARGNGMAVSASASTLGRWRGNGTGPVIGSGGGKASASFVESDAAGCCCGMNGELGKTLECPCGRPATVAHMRRIGAITETEVFCDACSPVVFI